MGYSAADSTKQKFTQKERDNESGLDYFLARYYSSAQGRFTSVDPITMKKMRLIDPQRSNLYIYARNNPLVYVDANGADITLAKDLNQKGHEKDRKYVVENLARLYMTAKGRAYLERADRSQFDVVIGKGTLERHRIGGPEKPGTTTIGGSEHVTGGLTEAVQSTDSKTGRTTLLASGPVNVEGLNLSPITVTIDKDNVADLGKDPAKVFAHEIGGHVGGILDYAEVPDQIDPANPSFDLTGRDVKKEEEAARKAEDIGKLPDKASPEAIKAVEKLLKKQE
jgi:RHS repeat-associated protein